jgi:hypothetical protein
MSAWSSSLGLAILGVLGCREHGPEPARTATSASVLPDIPGFAAKSEESGPTYSRRAYTRGSESTTVTLARFPLSEAQYEEWLRMSRADFPQAVLDLSPADGNGFYQCATDDASRCNLLVQLRCGLHLEIRGAGVARRADADAILAGLALPRLAGSCGSGGGP